MIELVDEKNILSASETFSSSWRFSHNGVVSGETLDEHTPERMRELIYEERKKGNMVYSYEDGGSRGIISFHKETNFISKLYVDPAHLRQGIGKALVLFAMSEMDKDRDVTVVSLNVNRRARAFYESLGFVNSGRIVDFGGNNGVFGYVYVYKRR